MEIDKNKMQAWLKARRKRERRTTRTLKGKALLTIDHLLSLDEDDDPRLRMIYRIAHAAAGVCGNPHEDWVAEIHSIYKALEVSDGQDS